MGERVAHLVTGKMIDFVEFVDGFAIAKTGTPRELHRQSLAQASLRSRFRVTVMGVKRSDTEFIVAQPDTVLLPKDVLIVAGTTADVESFAAYAVDQAYPLPQPDKK